MSSSYYNHHPFHSIGAATLLLWDSQAGGGGAWRSLGKVADASVIVSTEQAGKEMTIRGLTQPIARRNRSKRYSISFRLLENCGPEFHELMLSEGETQQGSPEDLFVSAELVRLYGADFSELAHPYGIMQQVPAGVGAPDASAGSTGGSIPPGTYYYWVVPYLEHGGQPQFEGGAGPTGSTGVSGGQTVTITFTPPPGYTPDAYRVYFNTTDSLGGAQIAHPGAPASPIVLTSHQGGGSYSPQDTPLVDVYSYDGAVQYAKGSDYSIDAGRGLIKRTAGGSIADGQKVLVVYAYERPGSIATTLGSAVELERYRRLKLLQLSAETDEGTGELTPENWRESGIEFEFYRVNVALGDTRLPFSEDDFSEGSSISWDCLYDSAEAAVGSVRSSFGVLASYS